MYWKTQAGTAGNKVQPWGIVSTPPTGLHKLAPGHFPDKLSLDYSRTLEVGRPYPFVVIAASRHVQMRSLPDVAQMCLYFVKYG